MNRAITIFKILTVVSFSLIMIPNEKFIIAMYIGLIALLIGYGGFFSMLMSAIILTAVVYVFILAFTYTKSNFRLSAIAILIFYIPMGLTFRGLFAHPYFISWVSYVIFIVISLITIVLLIRRLMMINN